MTQEEMGKLLSDIQARVDNLERSLGADSCVVFTGDEPVGFHKHVPYALAKDEAEKLAKLAVEVSFTKGGLMK